MPEITINDKLGLGIKNTIIKYGYIKCLEIGSHDGMGSTQCFIEGILPLSFDKDTVLHCLEISPDRFSQLMENTKQYPWIKCFNMSSISLDQFIPKSFDEIWDSPHNHLLEGELSFPKEMVRGWYEEDLEKLKNVKEGFLTSDFALLGYDMVIIDGSEFTGYSEYQLLKDKVKCFALDDCFTAYKCSQIYYELSRDGEWELLEEDPKLRNGYAIFRLKYS